MKEYANWFSNWEDVCSEFRIKRFSEPEHVYAWYDDLYGYSGQAIVAYFKNERFHLVEGSHCSCYGLEDQWEPEEYTPEQFLALVNRAIEETNGTYSSYYGQAPKLLELYNKAMKKYGNKLQS